MAREIEISARRSILLRTPGGAEVALDQDDLSMLLHYLLSTDALWLDDHESGHLLTGVDVVCRVDSDGNFVLSPNVPTSRLPAKA